MMTACLRPAAIANADRDIHCAVPIQWLATLYALIRFCPPDSATAHANQALSGTKIMFLIADLKAALAAAAMPLMSIDFA